MDGSSSRKAQSHARIVEAASRAIRERGFAGVGVADVMREAGLTHGGFYAHFGSRDDLLVAALEHAGAASAAVLAGQREHSPSGAEAFRAFVAGYLSERALESPASGCVVAALGSEMPRQTADVRRASSVRVRGLVRHVASLLPGIPAAQAAVIAGTLVGSLQIARALGPVEAKALLAAARDTLIARHAPDGLTDPLGRREET